MRRLHLTRLAAIWVTALLILIVSDGCAPQPEASLIRISHPTTLVGTTWVVVAIGGHAVPAGTTADLGFGPTDLTGDSPCNIFNGPYAYDPASGALRIGSLVSTKRACFDAGFNGVESAFLAALRGASDASIDPDGRLVLGGSAGAIVLGVGPVGVPAAAS